MPMPSENDVMGKPLPREGCWVLVVGPLSRCAVAPLRKWEHFAQSSHKPVIVITTSSTIVAKFFQKDHHFDHLYFTSDPLIADRPIWNVFMYPALALLDDNGRLLWICQNADGKPTGDSDAFAGAQP